MKPKSQTKTTDPLVELYPEINVTTASHFAFIFRKIKGIIEEIVFSYTQPELGETIKLKPSIKTELNKLTDTISNNLSNYYKEADCVVGVGLHISNQICKNPLKLHSALVS